MRRAGLPSQIFSLCGDHEKKCLQGIGTCCPVPVSRTLNQVRMHESIGHDSLMTDAPTLGWFSMAIEAVQDGNQIHHQHNGDHSAHNNDRQRPLSF